MVNKCSSYSKMTVFETLDSERHRKWRHNITKQVIFVCKCPGVRDTINCQIPGLRDSSWHQMHGVCRGGNARGWNWLVHKGRGLRGAGWNVRVRVRVGVRVQNFCNFDSDSIPVVSCLTVWLWLVRLTWLQWSFNPFSYSRLRMCRMSPH